MQTSAPGGHSFVIRPSTSPVPSFMSDMANVRKSTQSKMMNQAAAAARLRPIPGRQMNSGGSVLNSMCISGNKTGEEKVFSAVERRESAASKPVSTTPTEQKDSVNHQSLQLRKLEQEVRRLKEVIKTRNSERESLREKIGHQDSLLDGCNKRIVDLQQQLQAEKLQRSSEKERDEATIKALQHELDGWQSKSKDHISGMAEVESKYEARLRDAEKLHRDYVSSHEASVAQLRDEINRWKATAETAERRNDELRKELSSQKETHRKEMDAARAREERLLTELRDAKAATLERETRLDEWKTQIRDCNSYITKICQPQFSVVKDESLTPVSADDPDAGGFVLVPLALMLEGYQLLPSDMKKNIADEYERSKQPGSLGSVERKSPVEQAPHRPTTSPIPGAYTMRGRK